MSLQSEMATSTEGAAATHPGIVPAQAPTLGQLITLVILIAISSLTLLPLWRESTDHAFANTPNIRSLSPGIIEGLRLFALAIDAAQGLILGAAGLWLSAWVGLVPFRVRVFRSWKESRPEILALCVRSLRIGVGLFLISILAVVPQLIIFGDTAPPGTNAQAISQHHAVVGVMTKMLMVKGASSLVLGAPIFEEVEFRLFLLSLIAWLCARMMPFRRNDLPRAALWTAILVSGFAFGLMHVASGQSIGWWRPWYLQLLTDPRSYGGVVLGYVYWRWGLESSIAAHSIWNVLVVGVAQIAMLVI
jgi:membrane protease YdiL (CAAX protease family)